MAIRTLNSIGGLSVGFPSANVILANADINANNLNVSGNTILGNLNATNGVFTNVSGNGSGLTSVPGANVTGTVANATFATTSGTTLLVDGANVTGQVSNALVSGTVYDSAQPNITSVGTLSSLSATGNITGNFFIGNGSLLTGITQETYETVNKNLKSNPATFNYTGTTLSSIVYNTGVGNITKTFNYTSNTLTSVVLSGNTPAGISLTKTFTYTGENLTGITYT